MEAHLLRAAPALLIDLVAGAVGFMIALGWWKVSGREVDRSSTIFIAKVFGGVVLFGMFLTFVI